MKDDGDQYLRNDGVVVVWMRPVGLTPKRLKNGRWSVRMRCPDGISRVFRSTGSHEQVIDEIEPRRSPREPISPRLRFTILSRDGFACRYCGRTAPATELHVDHVQSLQDGGETVAANLITSCVPCNLGKGGRSAWAPTADSVADSINQIGGSTSPIVRDRAV